MSNNSIYTAIITCHLTHEQFDLLRIKANDDNVEFMYNYCSNLYPYPNFRFYISPSDMPARRRFLDIINEVGSIPTARNILKLLKSVYITVISYLSLTPNRNV